MAMDRPTCDSQRLHFLLRDELPQSEASQVTEHIETCSTCRLELEEMAAEKSLWQEAGRQLRGGEWNSDGTLTLSIRDPDESIEVGSSATLFSLGFLEPSENAALMGRLGEYEVIEVLGSGGFGIVLKAFDRELNRHVAIKVLAPHLANSAAARKRFSREAQAAAAVVHPNVVAIHTVDARSNLPYLVMPYIPGESLQQRLDRKGSLDIKEILRIGMQTAHGLAAAHAQGLVHRDIKPANILLEHGVDRVMLTDFGLARAMDDASLTRSTVIAGTPQYMSPEQTRGESIDHRTDLFSLGSVLYAMCTGNPPFRAETMVGVLRRVTEESPRSIRDLNSEIPAWLNSIIDRLLVKDRNRRFQTAGEVADLLETCLAHVQQPTRVPLPRIDTTATNQATKSTQLVQWISIGLVCIVIVGSAILAQKLNQPDQSAKLGQVEKQAGRQSKATRSPQESQGTATQLESKPDPSAEPQSISTSTGQPPAKTNKDNAWADEVHDQLLEVQTRVSWLEAFESP